MRPPLASGRKTTGISQPGKPDPFKTFRPLIPQLRSAVGSKVTDEALLTYLAKSEGNLDDAIRRFKLGPWGLIESSKSKSNSIAAIPHRTIPLTSAPSTSTKPPIPTHQSSPDLVASNAGRLVPTGVHVRPTRRGRGPSDSDRTIASFSSLPPEDVTPIFELGSFVADVTSSSRLGSELAAMGESSSPELHYENECQVDLQFGASTTKKRGWKSAKVGGPSSSSAAALSSFDSQILSIRESVSAQLLLCRDNRHIGRLSPSVAYTLGPLIFGDFIRLRTRLAPDPPQIVDIGSSIPIIISVFITSKGAKIDPLSETLTPQAESSLRDSWVELLFGRLALHPFRPSLFWSPQQLTSSSSSSTSSAPLTPVLQPSLLSSPESTSRVESPSEWYSEVGSVKRQRVDRRSSSDAIKESQMDTEESEEDELIDSERAVEKTEELFGEANHATNTEVLSDFDAPLDLHPAVFRSSLRQYQRQGVYWMRKQELELESLFQGNEHQSERGGDKSDLHPMWDEFEFPLPGEEFVAAQYDAMQSRPKMFYFNRTTGAISLDFVRASPQCRGGILADEMGLGKTVQTIALLALELNPTEAERKLFQSMKGCLDESSDEFMNFLSAQRRKTSAIKRHLALASDHLPQNDSSSLTSTNILHGGTLLVLPLSLIGQWKAELLRHMTPSICKIAEYYGPDRPRDALSLTQSDVVLTSYGTVGAELILNSRDNNHRSDEPNKRSSPLSLIHWRRIVLDEAHFIKTHTTRTCRAVCSLKASYRWCLTGTPIQNSVEDLFSLLHFLKVDPWGSWVWWSKLVIAPLQKKRLDLAVEAARRITLPLMLRRTKSMKDSSGKPIVELPPRKEHLIYLTLSEQERQFYDAVFHRASTEFDQLIQSGEVLRQYTHVLELLLRLRQAACHPLLIYSGSSTKVLKHFDNVSDITAHFLRNSSTDQKSNLELNESFLKRQLAGLHGDGELDECPICFEIPDDPGLLPCCHILCRACAINALNSSVAQPIHPGGQMGYPCPICRSIYTKSGIAALPGATKMSKRVVNCLFDEFNCFRYSSKLNALKTYLEDDIKAGHRAVVFSQWTSLLDILEVMLSHLKISHRRFDGSLNLKQRQSVVQWFSEPSSSTTTGRVLLVSLKAGGVGLNLVAACRAYVVDPWYNPFAEDQAVQRLHRIGQTQEVQVYRFIAEKTVEERIMILQQSKASQARGVLESHTVGPQATEKSKLGLDDLRAIFKDFSTG